MIQVSLELSDTTKWDKCQRLNRQNVNFREVGNRSNAEITYSHRPWPISDNRFKSEMRINLTDDESQTLSNVENPIFECHSETCDAGGHCDLGRQLIKFKMLMTYPYCPHDNMLRDFQLVLKEHMPSISPIFGVGIIMGKVDRREFLLWLKKMDVSGCAEIKDTVIVIVSDGSKIHKLIDWNSYH